MPDNILSFNGVDADTGDYLHSPLTFAQIKALALGETPDPEHQSDLQLKHERSGPHYGLEEGRNPKNLSQSGWAVVFPAESSLAIYDALKPLLEWRKGQAGDLYKEFKGPDGYLPGDTKTQFIRRHKAGGAGVVDPTRIPYYVLLVGSPEEIPFEFQYQLDVQYAVGRIHFDQPEDYAIYAQSVIAAEKGEYMLPRRASFFGVARENDPATMLSSTLLVDPLRQYLAGDQPSWAVDASIGEAATRRRLEQLIGGDDTPAFLFTASHGMGSKLGSSRQEGHTGALLCQDWAGPGSGADPRPAYLAGEDLSADAKLGGMIAMFFACYGAGMPKFNEFRQQDQRESPNQIATRSFVGALPKRMLSHPKGGALAVIGHVERAWDCSFKQGSAPPQLQTFKSTLKRLLEGHPVGSAMEPFNSRYAELSTVLTDDIKELKAGQRATDLFVGAWTSNQDARNYAVIGDPAVRLVEGVRATSRPPQSSKMSMPLGEAEAVQFGMMDIISDAPARIAVTLEKIVASVSDAIERTMTNLSALEVRTYVSDDISAVECRDGQLTGAELKAVTHIQIDGDTQVCVPRKDGQVDDALWSIHNDTVNRAVGNRAEMIKLAASAAANLLQALKK